MKNVEVGNFTYVAPNARVVNCKIGNFCSVGSHVAIGGAHHDYKRHSTSPVFFIKENATKFSSKNVLNSDVETQITSIGHDVWIGTKVIIKQGITIGNGSVIGAGSVVTKDVEAYTIVAGNPARHIKNRFGEDTILPKVSSYYNYSENELRDYLEK